MKQLWNTTSSDKDLAPNIDARNMTSTGRYQVNVTGLMNNSKQSEGDQMVGSAAW